MIFDNHGAHLVKWYCSKEKCTQRRKYFWYLHKTNTTAFTIISAIKLAKFHISNIIIDRDSLCGYVIYSSADAHF